jgi:NADH dehydrogenase
MKEKELHVVTGAFGYSGQYIARRILKQGHRVRTLTGSPNRRHSFGEAVEVHPFNFRNPEKLTESLRGASALYNTYWVRFNHAMFRHAEAVENTLRLFDAAARAGVGRVVHVSITNPSEDSPLEYFRGKARLERGLRESGLSHAILRPAVLFGKEDILINNIAWMLRRFPVFGVFGDGRYKMQPIYVDDIARLAVEQARGNENCVIDAIGPETFTFRGLVEAIGRIIGTPRPIVPIPRSVGFGVASAMGKFVGDVVLTRDEIEGLMSNLLYTKSRPSGETPLTEWTRRHRSELGRRYASELARRKNRRASYGELGR